MPPPPLQLLDAELARWEGTPYEQGRCKCGREGGVGCVHFVDAVVRAWRGVLLEPLQIPALGQWNHSADVALQISRTLLRRHPVFRKSPFPPGPGAVVIAGKAHGVHAVIVDGLGRWWHASEGGVGHTSEAGFLAGAAQQQVRGVYRWA